MVENIETIVAALFGCAFNKLLCYHISPIIYHNKLRPRALKRQNIFQQEIKVFRFCVCCNNYREKNRIFHIMNLFSEIYNLMMALKTSTSQKTASTNVLSENVVSRCVIIKSIQ